MRADVVVARERALAGRVVQQNGLVRPEHVSPQGLRQIGGGDGGLAQRDGHRIAVGCDLRLYAMVLAPRENEQASPGAGVLDGRTHERIDQLLQDDLARDRCRHLDHGLEVEVFDCLRDTGQRP